MFTKIISFQQRSRSVPFWSYPYLLISGQGLFFFYNKYLFICYTGQWTFGTEQSEQEIRDRTQKRHSVHDSKDIVAGNRTARPQKTRLWELGKGTGTGGPNMTERKARTTGAGLPPTRRLGQDCCERTLRSGRQEHGSQNKTKLKVETLL